MFAGWLKRLALYRFDGIFSEFIGSIGRMAEARYVFATSFKLLKNRKNSGIKDCTEENCHPEERSDVRISFGAVRPLGLKDIALLFAPRLLSISRDFSAVPQNDECFFQDILAFARMTEKPWLRTIGTRDSNKIKNKNVMFGSLTTKLGEKRC